MTYDDADALNWLMSLPVAADPPDGLAWHYTDLPGLLGILGSSTFWASASSHLNDTEEMKHGASRVRQALGTVKSTLTAPEQGNAETRLKRAEEEVLGVSTFVLCASTCGDSLSQWRGYGGSAGYSVGIDAAERLDLLANGADSVEDASQIILVSPWQRVLYTESEQLALAEEFVRRLSGDGAAPGRWNEYLMTAYGPPAYRSAISRMKHPGFSDERELRMLATATSPTSFYDFRPGLFGPTPYVKLTGVSPATTVQRAEYWTSVPMKLPIRKICIGPTPHAVAAEDGLRQALVRHEYTGVDVVHSDIPFR